MTPELFVSDIHGEYQQFMHVLNDAQKQLSEQCGHPVDVASIPVHVLGDIYDRGPAPDAVMDALSTFENLDLVWGNHDIVWMGASLGSRACIANVVRICARYGNLSILEDTYGINLAPLRAFALKTYAEDPCVAFGLKDTSGLSEAQIEETVKIQKAISFIQFKVEAQTIAENPSFELQDRNLLHCINAEEGTVCIEGGTYALLDCVFPNIDFADPYRLSEEEAAVMDYLEQAFTHCEKLHNHIRLFLDRGSLYKIVDNTLLLHACVPLNEDGSLKEVQLFGNTYAGKALFDAVDALVRAAYTATDDAERKRGLDTLWYLWLGQGSPLFAKSKMATFELYLCEDKAIRKEVKNSFYSLLDNEAVFEQIMSDFGLDFATSRIICGHTPVKYGAGESPLKCAGHVAIIDGGMSRAYQKTSGIGGMSVLKLEDEFLLGIHQPLNAQDPNAQYIAMEL